MNVNIDNDRWMEVSIIKGKKEDVRNFEDKVKEERKVNKGKLEVLKIWEEKIK